MTNEMISSIEESLFINLVTAGLNSEHSKRAYEKATRDFLIWYVNEGKPGLNKWTIQRYKAFLKENKLSSSTINQRLSAIRKLVREAADNDLIDQKIATNIAKIKGVKSLGARSGNWLSKAQAQELINFPDNSSLSGLRDRAILCLMVGAGLRRSEVSKLRLEDIQQRDGRWAIIDLIGKGNHVRTVPIPAWTKVAIDAWCNAAEISSGPLFLTVNKGDKIAGKRKIRKGVYSDGTMSEQAIADVVKKYAQECGLQNISAHDLRRTYSRLAKRGGADMRQIQLSLGHVSIKTTERYLGDDQNLMDAPCDHLGISLL